MFTPSLVQYENPQLITKNETKVAFDANRVKAEQMVLMSIEELMAEDGADSVDMLDVLMPPRISELHVRQYKLMLNELMTRIG